MLRKQCKDEIYHEYMANILGGFAGVKTKYHDLVDFDKPIDTRTGEQVMKDTIAGAGLVVVDG